MLRLILTLICFSLAPVAAQARDIAAFIWGNSLVHHLSDSDETAMPYWLTQMTGAGGHGLSVDGLWSDLIVGSANLPPEAQWGFDGALGEGTGFRRVGFDAILITPRNFIQDQPPVEPFAYDNPRGESPVSAALRLIDWSHTHAPNARFYIYEGWSDMGLITSRFPPRPRGLRRYYEFNGGDYHDWYTELVAALSAERPGRDIQLIPVASTFAQILREEPLDALEPSDLYLDNAPHGTGNLYLLAAMVSYASLYGEAPPLMDLPQSIHPVIRDNYADISSRIWQIVSGSALPDRAALTPPTGLQDPALAMGLNGLADWSTQMPFIDLMRFARPWIGHQEGQWGGVSAADLEAGGHLSPEGWLISIPPGVTAIESFILTDLPEEATGTIGRYRVTWVGEGDFDIGGRARVVERAPGEIWFEFSPGEGPVALRIEAVDPENPIRAISVLREDHIPLYELGEVFNPDWIARIRDLRMLRFMDWMDTNNSPIQSWDERPLVSDYTWIRRGVPLEVMIGLSNQIGADPWFTLPHLADDDYVRRFATAVHNGLDPDLVAYAEYSNEVWNFLFEQAQWAAAQAAERWNGAEGDAWMQFAGLRAAEVACIWAEVYSDAPERLVRVVGTQTSWPGLEEALLQAPLAQEEGLSAPVESFDAYAVAGYFGYDLGSEEMLGRVMRWLELEPDEAHEAAADALREGSFGEFLDDMLPYQAGVAREHDLALVMYEGGTHVVLHAATDQEERVVEFLNEFNYSTAMAGLYAELLTGWREAGGGAFNAFVDVVSPTRFGAWGALRHLDDMNPRWATLMAWNASAGGMDGPRAEGAFAQGLYLTGDEADDILNGTPESDLFSAGGGDDVLFLGPGDRAHGGEGRDRAVLLGEASDYGFLRQGALRILQGTGAPIRLVSVEELEFTSEPGVLYGLEAE